MLTFIRSFFKNRVIAALDVVWVLVSISFIVCGWMHSGDFSSCYLPQIFK